MHRSFLSFSSGNTFILHCENVMLQQTTLSVTDRRTRTSESITGDAKGIAHWPVNNFHHFAFSRFPSTCYRQLVCGRHFVQHMARRRSVHLLFLVLLSVSLVFTCKLVVSWACGQSDHLPRRSAPGCLAVNVRSFLTLFTFFCPDFGPVLLRRPFTSILKLCSIL